MQRFWPKPRLGAWALISITFPSVSTSILRNPLERLQEMLAFEIKMLKTSKQEFP